MSTCNGVHYLPCNNHKLVVSILPLSTLFFQLKLKAVNQKSWQIFDKKMSNPVWKRFKQNKKTAFNTEEPGFNFSLAVVAFSRS